MSVFSRLEFMLIFHIEIRTLDIQIYTPKWKENVPLQKLLFFAQLRKKILS